MIPSCIKRFQSELKRYQRDFIRINARPLNQGVLEDSLNLKASKFLGKPFFPEDKVYPIDKQGNPMVLAAQLNFEEMPALDFFPSDGILQLFLSATDWYEEEHQIVYHNREELSKRGFRDFSFLANLDFDEMPIYTTHQLSFEKDIDHGSPQDSQFDFLFGGEDFSEFIEGLGSKEEKALMDYFDASGHKLGGYAEFTQYDPRDMNIDQQDDIQLLQIDVDDHIMFGDSGVAHIFISKANLIKQDFSKAYFYWDCC